MAETSLPDYSTVWASGGDKLQPTNSKIALGWEVEIPPRQWFNWLDNKQDQAIQHIIQHGIAQWSSTIEYQAGKSFIQAGNGLIYKALITNTNISPVSDTAGNWAQVSLSPRGIQRFTSTGNFIVPYGVTTVYLSGCGGGGGGGGGAGFSSTNGNPPGGGGGAGASCIKVPVTVTPGQTISVIVGAGGTAGGGGPIGSAGVNGNPGGSTTFGTLLTLVGGAYGAGGGALAKLDGGYGGVYGGQDGTDAQAGAVGGLGGSGGSGPFGTAGGGGRSGNNLGHTASAGFGFGTGGGGGGAAYSSGAGSSGSTGMPGILIVEW